MRKPIVLTGPGATAEDVARIFNISPKRQAAIQEMVDEHFRKKAGRNGFERKRSASEPSGKKTAAKK